MRRRVDWNREMSSLLEHRSAPAPDVDELERLWAGSPDHEVADERLERPLVAEIPERVRWLRQLVCWGWPAFIVLGSLLAPPGAEEVPRAGWVDPAALGMLGLVLLGYLAFLTLPTLGFALFAGAGALGIALGIDCRVSAHHLGAWWMVETALVAGLAVASVAGLVLLSRR